MIKILSIDDQRDNQITIKGALTSCFKEAIFYFALSGKEGVQLAIEHQPDIILLDIMMPGIDGFETCRIIKADSQIKYIPVILLSAIGSKTENRVKGLEMGADAVMSKPFDPTELAAQISVMLRIKQAEDKLRKENIKLDKLVEEKISEIAYQAIVLENVSDAVISADTNFILKSWNDAAERTYGWKESEVLGKSYSEVLMPVYPEQTRDEVVEIFKSKGRLVLEVIHHHKDGSVLNILTSVSQILDKNGTNIGTVALNRDITKEKVSENQIHQLTTRLELAVKAIELGIWEWDLKANQLTWNDEFISMYGIQEQAPHEPLSIFEKYLYPEDLVEIRSGLKKLMETGEKFIIEHHIANPEKGKRTVISKAVNITDKTGKTLKVIGVSYDVTIRRLMEAQLKESEERYRTLIESSNDLVWITDVNGCFIFYNQHVEEVTGYVFDQYLGKSYESLIPEINKKFISEEYRKVLTGEKIQMETDVIFAGGVEHTLWINMAPIYEGDRVVSVATFARDVSDYRLAMEELKLALNKAKESDGLKSAFLATMSHELRTPLNAIIGFSSLLSSDMDQDEFQKFAEIIGDSGQHLLTMVEEIFDVTLIESGEIILNKENFELLPVVEDIKAFCQAQKVILKREHLEIDFQFQSDPSQIVIYNDKKRFQQVCQNLIKNALKFTEIGSVIYGFKEVTIGDKPFLQFYVSDTGIGIPEEKQEMIFEAFRQVDDTHTRKYDGVGLGLSVAKKLTDLMGGTLHMETELGVGSTFSFALPNFKSDELQVIPTGPKKQISFNGKTVLVVEDDIDSYHFLELVLLKHNATPVWAHNGKEAVNYCHENKLPWLVLMDLNMPVMNGLEATEKLKNAFPNLPIIAQTAYTIGDDINRAMKAGCNDVISKPIMIKKLITVMSRFNE
jgi:hypothetical protein